VFSVWQENEDGGTVARLIEAAAGVTAPATARFALSENDGAPGSDPYGHIHGRRFAASKPGLYTVGFRIVDTSANGTGGTPLHQPSEIFSMYFQAGLSIAGIGLAESSVTLAFFAQSGRTTQVESTSELGPGANWHAAGEPVAGTSRLVSMEIPRTGGNQFFRLRVTTP
jgi:hypothetical protein